MVLRPSAYGVTFRLQRVPRTLQGRVRVPRALHGREGRPAKSNNKKGKRKKLGYFEKEAGAAEAYRAALKEREKL